MGEGNGGCKSCGGPPSAAFPQRGEGFRNAVHRLEQFMGVKLFAWLGGFALFLGMAFREYSITTI